MVETFHTVIQNYEDSVWLAYLFERSSVTVTALLRSTLEFFRTSSRSFKKQLYRLDWLWELLQIKELISTPNLFEWNQLKQQKWFSVVSVYYVVQVGCVNSFVNPISLDDLPWMTQRSQEQVCNPEPGVLRWEFTSWEQSSIIECIRKENIHADNFGSLTCDSKSNYPMH